MDSAQLRAEKMPCSHKARSCSPAPVAEPLPVPTPVVRGPLLVGHSRLLKPSSRRLRRQRPQTHSSALQVPLSRLSLLHGFIPEGAQGWHLSASLNLQALPKRKQGAASRGLTQNIGGFFACFSFFFPHHHRVMSSLLQHARQASQPCPRHAQHQGDLGIHCPSGVSN